MMNRQYWIGVLCISLMGCERCDGGVVSNGPITMYSACETSLECGEDAPLCETFTITDADGGTGDYSWCTKGCEYPSHCDVTGNGGEFTIAYGECFGVGEDGDIDHYFNVEGETYCFEVCYEGDPLFGPWNCSQRDVECLLIQEASPSYDDDGTLWNDGRIGVCVPQLSSSELDGGMNE